MAFMVIRLKDVVQGGATLCQEGQMPPHILEKKYEYVGVGKRDLIH